MMPLVFANKGEENIIVKVMGKPEVKKHLEDLGFVPGSSITVLNALGGNIIVSVKGTRVALNDDMARKIMV